MMHMSPTRMAARAASPAKRAAASAAANATTPTKMPPTTPPVTPSRKLVQAQQNAAVDAVASLAGSHPHLAALWTVNAKAGSNSLSRPQNVDSGSTKLVHWTCGSCSNVYARRVRDQVAADGACPSCGVLARDAPAPVIDESADPSVPGRPQGKSSAKKAGRKPSIPQTKPTRSAAETKKRKAAQLEAVLKNTESAVASSSNADAADVPAMGLVIPFCEESGANCDALVQGKAIDPMLAQSWDTWSHMIPDKEELLISPKLDGIRCIVGWDSNAEAPVFLSRKGKVFESADHLVPYLKPLFEDDPTLVLDGELYNHHLLALDFELLAGAVRTTRSKRTAEVEAVQGALQYHIFDIMHSKDLAKLKPKFADLSKSKQFTPEEQAAQSMLHHGNLQGVTPGKVCEGSGYHVPFTNRYELLKNRMMPQLIKHAAKINKKLQIKPGTKPPIVLVPHTPSLKKNMTKELEKALGKNYEGVMIRRKGAGYAFGKRSPFLLKYKKMQDSEYEIVGMVPGKGKWTGSLGAMLCKTKNGHRFTVSPSVTEKMRKRMWTKRNDYVGKMLTVQYQGIGSGGVPRFPIGKCVRGQADGSDWM